MSNHQRQSIRIIGGKWKGRKINFPEQDRNYYKKIKNSNLSLIFSLVIYQEYDMLNFLLENNIDLINEKSPHQYNNILHICLLYNVSPRIFLLCYEKNIINFTTPNRFNIFPIDILTEKYANKILCERAWNKHRILFLIKKESNRESIVNVLNIKEIHLCIYKFL